MSRFCGNKSSTKILEAVDVWKEKCLLSDGSVFSDDTVWASDSFSELILYFTESPDEGSDSFLVKLEKQLTPAKKQTIKLAAEMLWFMQLIVSEEAMHANTKRQQLAQVWSWSGEQLDMSHPLLQETLESGVAHPGVAYNTRRWAEFNYLVEVCSTYKSLPDSEKKNLLSTPWVFSEWLDSFKNHGRVQLRHIMKFLLFPDFFERISTGRHKREIVNAFHNKGLKPGKFDFTEVDKEVYEIRQELEEQYGTKELDFYSTPTILAVWKQEVGRKTDDSIERKNVLSAIDEIDQRGVRGDEKSSTYDLIYNAKRYPPKLVFSLANKYSNGEELNRSSFEGGEGTKCFQELRDLDFNIERKDFVVELLKAFLAQGEAGADLTTREYPKTYQDLNMKVSFGQGVFSHVPWVSFTGYDQSTPNGIYPVYLYYKSAGVLILAYGISETNPPIHEWADTQSKERIKDFLQREFNHTPERYGESFVHSFYRLPLDFHQADVTSDLDALINEYHNLMQGKVSHKTSIQVPISKEAIKDPKEIALAFASALKDANIQFGARHEEVVRAFVSSLMTKPLVILTGLSGSGKTQIAIRFGEWLGEDRMLVVPVRPDWTGAEALFGYEDALKPMDDGRAAWSVPDTLKFLLRASENPDYPYLLVLDEMNLAHVERYFADVLSGMESDQPCLPNLKLESDGYWRLDTGTGEKLRFPKNVFIVGTVNVDETTYMFSPKVLDRANTFEFRVTPEDLFNEYRKPNPCQPGDMGLVRGFLEIGTDPDWHHSHDPDEKDLIANSLRHVHSLLSVHGFEFGYRVFFESQRFAAIYRASYRGDHLVILDLILMQKILPRLHGSRRRLEELLRGLAEFCFYAERSEQSTSPVTIFEPDEQDASAAKLPISYDKLARMLKSLRANQFTSFTE